MKRLLIYFLRAHRELDERGRRRADTGWITKLELAAKSYVELGFNLAQDYSTSQDTAFQDLKEHRTKECIYACYQAAKSEEDFYAAYDLYDTEDTNCPEKYSGKTITWSRKDRIPRPQYPNRVSTKCKRKRRRHGDHELKEEPVIQDTSDDGTEEAEEYTEPQETHYSASFSSSQSSQLPFIPLSTRQRQTSIPSLSRNNISLGSLSSFPVAPQQPASLVATPQTAERQDSWQNIPPQMAIASSISSLDPSLYTSTIGQSGEHTGLYHVSSTPIDVRRSPGVLRRHESLGLQMMDIGCASWNHQVIPTGLPYLQDLTQEQVSYVNMATDTASMSYPTEFHQNQAPLAQCPYNPEHLSDTKHWMGPWNALPVSTRLSPELTFATS